MIIFRFLEKIVNTKLIIKLMNITDPCQCEKCQIQKRTNWIAGIFCFLVFVFIVTIICITAYEG